MNDEEKVKVKVKCHGCKKIDVTTMFYGENKEYPEDFYLKCPNCDNWESGELPTQTFDVLEELGSIETERKSETDEYNSIIEELKKSAVNWQANFLNTMTGWNHKKLSLESRRLLYNVAVNKLSKERLAEWKELLQV